MAARGGRSSTCTAAPTSSAPAGPTAAWRPRSRWRGGAPVHLLDYRRGPEHKHPAALDDSLAAYRDLLGSGLDPKSIVIVGDSAGGGLAVALAMRLRDAAEPLPGGLGAPRTAGST